MTTMAAPEVQLVDELLAVVRQVYPDWMGFEDPRFVEEERQYKLDAVTLARDFLDRHQLAKIIESGEASEVVDRVRRVAQKTNLLYLSTPSTGDLAVLERDELTVQNRAELIFHLLYGEGPAEARLEEYRARLQSVGLPARWPLPTYLLFLLAPDEEVFVKPSVIRWLAAKAPDFTYESVVTPSLYLAIRTFHHEIGDELDRRGFAPRDMIDVQSFVWVAYFGAQQEQPPAERPPKEFPTEEPAEVDDAAFVGKKRFAEARVPVHHDAPADVDELGRRPFADIVAKRIRQSFRSTTDGTGQAAFAVHIHGPWGFGKTSILNFLRRELETGDDSWIVVDLNAWKHQRIRPPWWPLIQEVYRQGTAQLEKRGRWNARWVWWRWTIRTSLLPVLLSILTIVAFGAFLGFVTRSDGAGVAFDVKEVVSLLVGLLSLVAALQTGHRSLLLGSSKAAQAYMELRSDPLEPLSRLFERLTRSFGHPVAIFIDDLDRCDSDYVVDLLEGIQTLFRQASVVYVVAADRDWIRTSFERRYESFLPNVGAPGRPLGHLFLEKMFQISVAVPRLSYDARIAYWQRLLATGVARSAAEAQELTVARRDELFGKAERPDEIQRVVEQHRGGPEEEAVRIAAAQRLSTPEAAEATEHFLAAYARLLEPNPRSMKRLVNAFGLQHAVNVLSHVDVPLEALALWTILEQRWPTLADLLAAHPDLIDCFAEQEAPIDPRVPEALQDLFGRDAVRHVIGGYGGAAQLDRDFVARLVGESRTSVTSVSVASEA